MMLGKEGGGTRGLDSNICTRQSRATNAIDPDKSLHLQVSQK